MSTGYAALPILLVLVLMIGLRWSAVRAGIAGCASAAAVAVTVFDFGGQAPGASTMWAGVWAEAGFTALTILWIIGPALGIHGLQVRLGSTEVLRRALGRLSPDPRILALLIAWFFALFLEGAAGFGASVALAAPFLVGVGYGRVEAVVIAMVGHAAGVSFGAVGTPILPQLAATEFSALELAGATSVYHASLAWTLTLLVMWMASRTSLAERTPEPAKVSGIWWWTLGAAAAFLVPYQLIAQFVGPELPTIGGALLGGGALVAALLWRSRAGSQESAIADPDDEGMPTAVDGVRAAAPYLALVGMVLVTRLIAPLRESLQGIEIAWTLPGGFAGSVAPLYHPGTMLLTGFLLGAVAQRVTSEDIATVVRETTVKVGVVALALLAMLLLARTMVHAGMVETLAEAAAATLGPAWPFAAAFVGVLGTFVTGSATTSNILFTDLQVATAETLDVPALPLLGAQGFGAAVGNIICPHNIVAASATVGLSGDEGEVLRRTLPVCLAYTALGGVLALVLVG